MLSFIFVFVLTTALGPPIGVVPSVGYLSYLLLYNLLLYHYTIIPKAIINCTISITTRRAFFAACFVQLP